MKQLMMVALVAAVAVMFTGCKKEETAGQKLDNAIQKVEKAGADAKKAVEKTAADVKKKVDEAAKK